MSQIEALAAEVDEVAIRLVHTMTNRIDITVEARQTALVGPDGRALPQPITQSMPPHMLIAALVEAMKLAIEQATKEHMELQAKANPSGLIIPGGPG